MKKRGRPFLAEQRFERMTITMTKAQAQWLRSAAGDAATSVSAVVRGMLGEAIIQRKAFEKDIADNEPGCDCDRECPPDLEARTNG